MSSATPFPMPLAMVTRPARAAFDNSRAADKRLGPELQRVQVLVVDAPIDDMDGHLALGRPQEDVGAMADEVPPLHEVHAHEAGEQGVLVERGVVHAGSEHHDRRVCTDAGAARRSALMRRAG